MSFIGQTVNLHSPGPIGDVTSDTVGSTTVNATNKLTINTSWAQYDFRAQLPSNGEISWTNTVLNSALAPDVRLVRAAASELEITGSGATGLVFSSADGTRYLLNISNVGVATVTPV